MNAFTKQIIAEMASVLPLNLLKSGRNLPVFLPFYHLVSDSEDARRGNYNYPSVKQFRDDLDFMLKHFKPISLEDLLAGKNLKGSFHLSFDDGLRECYEVVAPILKEKGVPATFFINPSFVDNKDLFHRYKASEITAMLREKSINIKLQRTYADLASLDEMAEEIGLNWDGWLQKNKPYMTLEQIKTMQADGFTFGSHTMDHPEFELLDEETQLDEIRESMEWVVEKLNPAHKVFAFPFTDFGVSDIVFETCFSEQIFDASFGTAGLKNEQFDRHFQRVPMEVNDGPGSKALIKQEFLAYKMKRLLGKHYTQRF